MVIHISIKKMANNSHHKNIESNEKADIAHPYLLQ